MATEHWFRWHHGTVTDPKWMTVASRASASMSRNVTRGHVLSVWCAMMENASQANPRGTLSNWSDEDIGAALGIPEDEVAAIRDAMQGKTLDGYDLTAWKRRQPKAEDTTAAERKRAQRERDRLADVTAAQIESRNVTYGHDRGEESRGEEKKQKQAPQASPSAADDGSKRGTRLPDDWQPAPDLIAWARSEHPHVELRAEVPKFRDYWHAKAGKDAAKRDWAGTFRNWIRTAAERTPRAGRLNGADAVRPRRELTREAAR